MKISVVVIAHNEEQNIDACLCSLLAQSVRADEIVLINHNSTDRTAEIAQKHPVRVVELHGQSGSVHARIRGLQEVSGDIVLCIDGDSIASHNWVEVLSNLLQKDRMVMVGSWVRMSGTLLARIAGWRWYVVAPSKNFRATDYLFGASLGLWGRDKDYSIRALKAGDRLSNELGLGYNPDDYWLALFMSKKGNLEVTNKTFVTARAKEVSSKRFVTRSIAASGGRRRILDFMKKKNLPKL